MKLKIIHTVVGLLLTFLSTTIQAETWQVGLAVERSQSPFVGDQKETDPIPMINYIGERFSFIAGQLNYELNPGATGNIYLTGKMRQRQFYTNSLNLDDLDIEGMENRNPAFESGLGFKEQMGWGQVLLEGLVDITNVHQGYELTAKYSYPKQAGRWLIQPSIGLQLQSRDLVSYYHGVRVSESEVNRPSYRGDQAINILTNLMIGYTINSQWFALASLEQIKLDSSISDSPIVDEKQVQKIYLGLIYSF